MFETRVLIHLTDFDKTVPGKKTDSLLPQEDKRSQQIVSTRQNPQLQFRSALMKLMS
jgi:hypothetical protein